jgi:hypothetical protein
VSLSFISGLLQYLIVVIFDAWHRVRRF